MKLYDTRKTFIHKYDFAIVFADSKSRENYLLISDNALCGFRVY